MNYIVGSWYESQGTVYVIVNAHGTIRRFHAVKWYKIIFLYFLQLFGKRTHLQDVLDYLK